MGQIKKIVPKQTRDKIVDVFEQGLPEGSLRRDHFANAISVSGAVLVASGAVLDAKGYKKSGMVLRGIGEAADDVDGDSARRLETAGRPGALVDATLDKIKVAIEVGVLWGHARNMTEIEATSRKKRLAFIATKHAVNATLNMYVASKGIEKGTSPAGSANMWADGLAIGLWGISDASESPRVKTVADTLGNVAFAAGVVTGAVSAFGYAEQALQARDLSVAERQYNNDTSNLSFQHL